jgi:hypothetical protein
MIRPLRVRHRWTITTLAVALPLGLAAAVVAREPAQVSAVEEAALEDPPLGEVFVSSLGPWNGVPVDVRIGREGTRSVVEFAPTEALLRPDLLVYWNQNNVGEQLRGDAVLLGKLGERTRRFRLPAPEGYLSLFDLARGELIQSLPVPAPLPGPLHLQPLGQD